MRGLPPTGLSPPRRLRLARAPAGLRRHSMASGVGDAAAALLGPDGPLAHSEGYEYREAQLQMAKAVGQTLERKRRLMVEAGTELGNRSPT